MAFAAGETSENQRRTAIVAKSLLLNFEISACRDTNVSLTHVISLSLSSTDHGYEPLR